MTLALHNPLTHQTTELTQENLRPIAPHELLILPTESTQDFLHLQTAWTQDYPGSSQTIQTLRHDLVLAHWRRLRIQTIFQQLQLDLHLTGLPMHHWDRHTQHQFNFIQKQHAQALAEFRQALKLLQAAYATQKSSETKSSKDAKDLKPPPFTPTTKLAYLQNCKIEIVDGKITHEIDFDAAYFLERSPLEDASYIKRHYYFPNFVIPEPYSYLLTYKGKSVIPTRSVFISYTPEEFLRICQREVDTKSEYLLDGDRLNHELWGYPQPK